MDLNLWFGLLAICIMGAVSPGPSLAVVLKHTMGGSAKHGCIAAISHGVGVGLYAAASLLGLASLMQQFPLIFNALVYLGAAYLAYLGIKILFSQSNGIIVTQSQPSNYKRAALDGFAIAFFNPKLAIFFIALFSQFIQPEAMSWTIAAVMCGTVLIVDALWYVFVAILSEKMSQKFNGLRNTPWLDKLLGCAFLILAIRVLITE